MNNKIPEALAVLKLAHSWLPDGMLPEMRKAEAAFAAEHVALKWAVDNPDDNAYWIKQATDALAAVEELK